MPTAKIYYLSSKFKLFYINKLVNIFRYYRANLLGIKKIKQKLGGFDLVHIHILTRLGLIGLYYKILCGKPYLVSEHWSRYLELTGAFNGYFRKLFTRIIVKNASFITTVTDNLAQAMKSHQLLNSNYVVLPNVVDDTFIKTPDIEKNKNSQSVFVHVSCFEDKSKNISGLLRTISELSITRSDFIFKLVGDGMDMEMIRNYASELGLTEKQIVFTGLLEGEKLVNEMASADMMVVFSNYENFPVVINESLSLGVPVIATRVGGIPERINGENGVLIDAGSEEQLLASMLDFMNGDLSFNMDKIKSEAQKEFSPISIGKVLCELYNRSSKDNR